MHPEGAPKALDWQFESPAVELDLAAQTLAQASFVAQFGAAELEGVIAGSQLIDAPALNGSFELAQLAPRELMAQFGIAPPVTRDSTTLARFGAKGKYAWQGGVARMTDLALALDESKLAGRIAYDTASSGLDFALTLDRIDLDRYQPPPTNPDEKTEPIELPVDFLKPMRAKGSFNVGQIKIGGANLTDLSAGIDIANAQARFAPLAAKLYGGTYRGDIRIDMRPAVPRLSMDEHLTGIDIAALMKEYADSKRLSGRGNLDVKLVANGRSGDELLKTLSGTLGLNLQDGAVEGIDVWYAIAQAQSLIQKQQLAAAANSKRTAFDSFRATADVTNGVATTSDLNIASQLLQITGCRKHQSRGPDTGLQDSHYRTEGAPERGCGHGPARTRPHPGEHHRHLRRSEDPPRPCRHGEGTGEAGGREAKGRSAGKGEGESEGQAQGPVRPLSLVPFTDSRSYR